MRNRFLIVITLFLLAFNPSELKASDWRSVVDLRGSWYFTVGDDSSWADPAVDMSDWDRINAPEDWEHYYQGYNGYAWYRKSFNMEIPDNINMLTLFLGYIDDADEVFINGQKVGQSGKFPPNFRTAYNQDRRYLIPVSVLKPGKNVICVRVFDEAQNGGIVRADRFGLYYDRDENLLDVNLSGTWKFSTERERGLFDPSFNDDSWDDILVPMPWESQGYTNYDGLGWYRKQFSIPDRFMNEELNLVLGRIDDFDKVFLNGQEIGRVEDLPYYSRFRKNNCYRLFRSYELPQNLLRHKNVITVEVYDEQGEGGIYDGPVGIIERRKADELSRKYRWESQDGGWGSFVNDLLELLD